MSRPWQLSSVFVAAAMSAADGLISQRVQHSMALLIFGGYGVWRRAAIQRRRLSAAAHISGVVACCVRRRRIRLGGDGLGNVD